MRDWALSTRALIFVSLPFLGRVPDAIIFLAFFPS